ncbi:MULTISPECIES: hypothetical protein [Oscillatoriales]|uniref:Uncharacterized protein n=1 Tax=Aerosakkonema funiforme FACHB-1375 TaxID=2949571 RepID=A0A926VK03_9CYAN|nr:MULTISPECIES: hypothetical protein [Oscillatoriales]MBD2184182.1 hypothetical protein [Aerosakkonema funiforme FACHB-1375]
MQQMVLFLDIDGVINVRQLYSSEFISCDRRLPKQSAKYVAIIHKIISYLVESVP